MFTSSLVRARRIARLAAVGGAYLGTTNTLNRNNTAESHSVIPVNDEDLLLDELPIDGGGLDNDDRTGLGAVEIDGVLVDGWSMQPKPNDDSQEGARKDPASLTRMLCEVRPQPREIRDVMHVLQEEGVNAIMPDNFESVPEEKRQRILKIAERLARRSAEGNDSSVCLPCDTTVTTTSRSNSSSSGYTDGWGDGGDSVMMGVVGSMQLLPPGTDKMRDGPTSCVAQSASVAYMWQKLRSEFKCNICLEVMAAPTLVGPCGHSFCGACLDEWVQRCQNTNASDPFGVEVQHRCPTCRGSIQLAIFERHLDQLLLDRATKVTALLRDLPDEKESGDEVAAVADWHARREAFITKAKQGLLDSAIFKDAWTRGQADDELDEELEQWVAIVLGLIAVIIIGWRAHHTGSS